VILVVYDVETGKPEFGLLAAGFVQREKYVGVPTG